MAPEICANNSSFLENARRGMNREISCKHLLGDGAILSFRRILSNKIMPTLDSIGILQIVNCAKILSRTFSFPLSEPCTS